MAVILHCFLDNPKGRARALRLLIGAKRMGIKAKIVPRKNHEIRICVVARGRKPSKRRRNAYRMSGYSPRRRRSRRR